MFLVKQTWLTFTWILTCVHILHVTNFFFLATCFFAWLWQFHLLESSPRTFSFGFNYLRYCLKSTGGASSPSSRSKVALEHNLSSASQHNGGLKPSHSIDTNFMNLTELLLLLRGGFCALSAGDGLVRHVLLERVCSQKSFLQIKPGMLSHAVW